MLDSNTRRILAALKNKENREDIKILFCQNQLTGNGETCISIRDRLASLRQFVFFPPLFVFCSLWFMKAKSDGPKSHLTSSHPCLKSDCYNL